MAHKTIIESSELVEIGRALAAERVRLERASSAREDEGIDEYYACADSLEDLIRWICLRTGFDSMILWEVFHRLNTSMGLSAWRRQGSDRRSYSDRHSVVARLKELDQDPTVQASLTALLDSLPVVVRKTVDGATTVVTARRRAKKRRGRPADTDPRKDEQAYKSWKTCAHRTVAEHADALNRDPRELKRQIDRHRKRMGRKTT